MNRHRERVSGLQVSPLAAVALMCLGQQHALWPRERIEQVVSAYVLPLALFAFAITLIVWRLKAKDSRQLVDKLARAEDTARQRERERDLAQEELFRRLYEARELNKEKIQFQSQLAEYEKCAALAQLALGAAHEINSPSPRNSFPSRTAAENSPGRRAHLNRTGH